MLHRLELCWIVICILTAAGLFSPAAVAVDAATRPATVPAAMIRTVCFNIRNADANDGPNAWPLRRDVFVKMVRKLDPDVLGLQEVLVRQQHDLIAALPEYDSVFVGRDDAKEKGEGSPVFFRRERFDLKRHGTFWLSETPDKPGLGWDAVCNRVCTWVLLHDKIAGRNVMVANTHFDHVGVKAREEAAKLIVARTHALGDGTPTVLMGDLNSTDESSAYAAFMAAPAGASGRYTDTYRAMHPQMSPDEATFHGFMGGTKAHRIDYIFTPPELETVDSGIDRDRGKDGRWPSDHYPVWATLKWK